MKPIRLCFAALAATLTAAVLAASPIRAQAAPASPVLSETQPAAQSAAVNAAPEDPYVDVTYSPTGGVVDYREIIEVGASIYVMEPTVLRLQRYDESASPAQWVDIDTADVDSGGSVHYLLAVADQSGIMTLRVVMDATPSDNAYVGDAIAFTVPNPPPSLEYSSVTMKAPERTVVPWATAVSVSGRIIGAAVGRAVALQLDTPTGWMTLTKGRADATGRYTLKVPTDWYYRGTVRAFVAATETHAEAASSTRPTLRVKPNYTPAGRIGDYTRFDDRARWNPCQTITYRVNTAKAPDRALWHVKKAMRLLHAATGLRFRYLGTTTAIPFRTDGKKAESGADLDIAWATPRQVGALAGWTIGWGGVAWQGDGTVVDGGVALDRTWKGRQGFGGQSWGSLILHELGHAVGLGHARNVSQVMFSGLTTRAPGRFQAGDLNGLRMAGASRGCMPGDERAARVAVSQPLVHHSMH